VVKCPTNQFGVTAEGLIQCSQHLSRILVTGQTVSVSPSELESMKYLLISIGSYSLLRDLSENSSEFSFHPFSVSDCSSAFTFNVCGAAFTVGSLSASLLSLKAFTMIHDEGIHSITVIRPSNIEESEFLRVFSSVLSTVHGLSLRISSENVFAVLSISQQLENSELISASQKYLESIVNTCKPAEALNSLIRMNTIDPELVKPLVEIVASSFYELDQSELLLLSPSLMRSVLSRCHLEMNGSDELYFFLEK
jgi:hypothetical protein